ncbi:MAG: PA domain-containing protein [Crocinitomicaceae bacterium]
MKKLILSLLTLTVIGVNANSQIICRVLEPASIMGNKPFTWADTWGGTPDFNIPNTFVQDTLAIAEDGTPGNSTTTIVHTLSQEGCATFTNAAQIAGKIAVVYRGTCNFTVKAANAQAAGAVGVIIINRDPDAIALGGTDPAVTIPAVMIGSGPGQDITNAMSSNTVVAFLGNKQGILLNDLTISSEWAKIPASTGNSTLLSTNLFLPAVTVYNYGSGAQSNCNANLKIVGPGIGGATVYDNSVTGLSIASGDSISVEDGGTYSFPSLDVSTLASGEYFLTYSAYPSTTEMDSADNQYSSSFNVTTNFISSSRLDANNDPIHNTYPQNTTNPGQYDACMSYTNANSEDIMLTGLKFVPSADTSVYDMTGEEILLNIYEWSGPNDLTTIVTPAIFNTAVYLPDNTANRVVQNVTFSTPVILTNDVVYLVCATSNGVENVVFGFDNNVDYSGNMSYDILYSTPIYIAGTWYSGWSGTTAISFALEVTENTLGLDDVTNVEASVFPNPTNDVFNVRVNTVGKATIQLTDISGKIVSTNEVELINGATQVNTTNLETGAYIMTIITENGATKNVHVVKN